MTLLPIPLLRAAGRGLLLALLLVGLARPAAQAQGWTGIANSNYAGTNALYWNPANIADSPYKFYLSLGGADLNFYNSYLGVQMPYTPWQVVRGTVPNQYRDENGHVVFREEYLQETLDGKPKFASASAEVRLPSFMVALGPNRALAFSSRVRGFVQATNVSEPVARFARYGFDEAPRLDLANKALSDNSFNVGVNAYHELALTYAANFTESIEHYLKGGFTVKYLAGLGSAYVQNEGISYQVYGNDSIQVNSRKGAYGSTDYRYYQRDDFRVSDLYGSNSLGWGAGFDLGMVYEWRPHPERYSYTMDSVQVGDPARNKYRLKVGLALTDVGAIQYNNPQYVRNSSVAGAGSLQWGSLDTIRYRNLAAVDNLMQRTLGLNSKTTTFDSFLPAALRMTADYRLREHVYLSTTWTQNILRQQVVGSRTISSLALTPRIEWKQAELAVPVIWNNGYRNFQVGAMLRLGPLVLGSDNLGSLFGASVINGYDVYASIGWGIGRKRIKDTDRDGVSDKVDKCPGEKGVWEFRGCADRDGDHVPDAGDHCPEVPGLAMFHGCPDTDEDGIQDSEDQCPTEAGPPETQGCPDRDNDGVTDEADHCPDTAGPADHAGCPDSDSDGIYDDTDKCPFQPGSIAKAGCPDSLAAPLTDTLATAPLRPIATVVDTDRDGTPDAADACPHTPGPASNRGCPVLKKAEQRIVTAAFANLTFRTGKDIINPTSYRSLDALAKLLRTQPTYRLRLSGHTDNVGKPKANLLLSEKRAKAVQRYLVRRGVPAGHIQTTWYGQAQPRASNKTATGRARNRRVEMKVGFE